jgi:hypothetical protein
MRRIQIVVAVSLALVLLSASAAAAFECINSSRSDAGNAGAAGSHGWFSLPLEEIFGFLVASHDDPEFNLPEADPSDIPGMVADAESMGVPSSFLLNAHAVAAGGLEGHDRNGVLADGHGIDHFPELYGAQLFTAYCLNASGDPTGTACEA